MSEARSIIEMDFKLVIVLAVLALSSGEEWSYEGKFFAH